MRLLKPSFIYLFLLFASSVRFPGQACAQQVDPVSDAGSQPVPPHRDERLQEKLEQIARGFRGRVGIYVRHLPTMRTAALHADSLFPTASLIKMPFLLTTFTRIEQGALNYRQPLVLRDSLRSPGSGLLASFNAGAKVRLSEAVMLMLTISDNTAAHWLEQLVGGGAAVNEWLAARGFEKTRVNSGVLGRRVANERYGWGQTTPREMAEMLVMIRNGEAVSPAASAEMYRELTRSYWDGMALSQIPPAVEAASKQGWVPRSRSEVVLVNAPHGDYVFCVITADQEDTRFVYDNAGFVLIRRVSRLLWNYFEPASDWQPPASRGRYRLVPPQVPPGEKTWWQLY